MEAELEFAKRLGRQAGQIMLRHFAVGVDRQDKSEEGGTPVTVADREINSLVVEAIRRHYPEHAIVAEEESLPRPGASYTWVCDPLDGTASYILGMPTSVFALALVDAEGRPIMAVVYDPYMKREYWATKGGGAFMNGKPIRVNGVDRLKDAAAAASGRRCRVIDFADFKADLNREVFRFISTASTTYEAMLVATGQIAATVLPGWHCWDAAMSKLIVEEAGGRVTDLLGLDQRYDRDIGGAIVSNGAIHPSVLALAKRRRLGN